MTLLETPHVITLPTNTHETDPMSWSLADAFAVEQVPVCFTDTSYWQKKILDREKFARRSHANINRAGSIDNLTGVCYEDFDFFENAEKLDGLMPQSAYWYYRPNHDPIKQADYFSRLYNKFMFHIGPVADVECNPNKNSKADFARWLLKFLARVEYNTGAHPLIYTRGEFWNTNIGNPDWAGDYELIIARYTTYPKPWGNIVNGKPESDILRPAPWNKWAGWQHSADGNMMGSEFGVGSNSIDLNRYNGSLADFYAWCGWQQPPDPELPTEPTGCGELIGQLIPLRDKLTALIEKWQN